MVTIVAGAGNPSGISRSSLVLLRLCSAPDSDLSADFLALTADEWHDLFEQAIDKRVAMILARALDRLELTSHVPEACRDALEDERRRLSMSEFGHMIALTEAVTFLQSHGIPSVALKGVRLAFHDYPQARLRPLRDLDLLVPADQAERAQQLMISSGTYEVAPWSDFYGIEFGHQLPELVDRHRGVSIEIHHRLNARDWEEEPMLVRMVLEDAEEMPIEGATVRVPSIHANFLHLVEHATLHHMFENGPITLADLHFTAIRGPIEWPLLIAQAKQMGLERALQLVCALAVEHRATWVPEQLRQVPPDVAENQDVCVNALLRDENLAEHAVMLRGIAMRKGRSPGWQAAFRAAVTPSPMKLAGIMRVKSENPLRWLAYPVWLLQRGKAYLTARQTPIDADTTVREVSTLLWLRNR